MRVSIAVGSIDHCLKLRDVLRVSKINDIDSDIVSLHSDTEFLELCFRLLKWVPDEDNNSLSLTLVLSMLQAQLRNFDGVEKVGLTVYCNFWLTIFFD